MSGWLDPDTQRPRSGYARLDEAITFATKLALQSGCRVLPVRDPEGPGGRGRVTVNQRYRIYWMHTCDGWQPVIVHDTFTPPADRRRDR